LALLVTLLTPVVADSVLRLAILIPIDPVKHAAPVVPDHYPSAKVLQESTKGDVLLTPTITDTKCSKPPEHQSGTDHWIEFKVPLEEEGTPTPSTPAVQAPIHHSKSVVAVIKAGNCPNYLFSLFVCVFIRLPILFAKLTDD